MQVVGIGLYPRGVASANKWCTYGESMIRAVETRVGKMEMMGIRRILFGISWKLWKIRKLGKGH